jgi:hypothetical protein
MPKCAICLTIDAPNAPHDRYVQLPCQHFSPNDPTDALHLSCLAQAFETQAHEGGQPSCPVCRALLAPAPFQALVDQFTQDRREGRPCSLDSEETDIPELIAWLDAEAQSLAERANAGANNNNPPGGGANPGGGGDDQNDDDGGADGPGEGGGPTGGDSGGGYAPPGDQGQGDNWGGGGEGYR